MQAQSLSQTPNSTDINVRKRENELPTPPQNVGSPAIFILDNASLKVGLVGKNRKILCSVEDVKLLLKKKKNLNDYRPEIIHEALKTILDSPLNKSGMVGVIYVKIDQGVAFEVNPCWRIPRSRERFCSVIMELLQKSLIRTEDTNEVLLRVVEEPTCHLPVNSHIVGLSYTAEKLVDIKKYVAVWSNDLFPVLMVGAMVNEKVKKDPVHDYISVSEYPLGTDTCLGMILEAIEQKWEIYYNAVEAIIEDTNGEIRNCELVLKARFRSEAWTLLQWLQRQHFLCVLI
ncbi:hypothetical protein RJT34_17868 [Clitoria ternatea]|uniref:Uncharacterized protein n=1 Tax=Clitoria ternatea TaxID=43366 RepID=A0AAN9JA46_CLITE